MKKRSNLILTAGPSITEKEISYVNDAVTNGWNDQWNKYIIKFEESFAKYIGVKHAMTTSSCTGAMHLALQKMGIGPGDPIETKELICQTYDLDGPIYIRLGKNGEPNIHKNPSIIEFGKAAEFIKGDDLILITTSNMLETGNIWVEEWKKDGVNVTLVSMHTIKPLDQKFIEKLIEKLIDRKLPIITLEEHNLIGGLGSAVAEIIAESGFTIPFRRIGINDKFSHYVGNHNFQRKKFNLNEKPDLDTLFKKSI